ncbi:uncharacterized protein LOC110386422 [Bombyx mori]|uniref:Pentraxin (PTX) domain-containing protein n=1 Tax=Bombyx mori TaxID=7091 RepID=A0A8R2HRU2_BOMMO|nr:uncharacterized protein LOC110386422 [Bombyx mori]
MIKMLFHVFVLFSLLIVGEAINRSVYKIILIQKGYAQFLQYDVETPPLKEFTFCSWIRVYKTNGDQTIFTYVANGNNRIVRLCLDSGGRNLKLSIDGRVTSSTAVDIVKDAWKHICLSYQSDYGAWALYVDSRLVSCEAAQSLYGHVLPGGGSIIVGYGTADNGSSNGLEGEIFGVNMILASTIEKNYTNKNDPQHTQKPFSKNKLKTQHRNNYIILGDLQTDEIHNNFENTPFQPVVTNETKSFIKFRTPYSFVEHEVGVNLTPTKTDSDTSKEIFYFKLPNHSRSTTKNPMNFWNFVNDAGHAGKFKTTTKTLSRTEQSVTGTHELPIISEFETPPPLIPPKQKLKSQLFEVEKPPLSFYKINDDSSIRNKNSSYSKYLNTISEVETPPPVQKNTKVYGQWTSSKFAGSVLNYLKSINFYNREHKKVPSTIPLIKLSDSFPYPSELKITKLRPPPQFQRRNLVERRFDTNKKNAQINVQILEDDLRSSIIKTHAMTQPKQVKITSRGTSKKNKEHRFYRNVDDQNSDESSNSVEEVLKPQPFSLPKNTKSLKYSPQVTLQHNNLLTILPFLKSLEYFFEDSQNTESKRVEDMYTKSLSNGNKWHNVKTYSNDFTPRQINMDSDGKSGFDKKISAFNKKYPSALVKYRNQNHKLDKNEEATLLKGRELAVEVSNQSDSNKNSISILKYNHGFLPEHEKKVKISDKLNLVISGNSKARINNNFNKNVKLGNALNERNVIGVDEEQKKKSFVGGDETVPDINRYRSDLDKESVRIPGSLGPRVCKNVELYDRVLYVQPDESIDMTHILSPVRAKNVGIEFIVQNYKKCSMVDSTMNNNEMLFIDWNKTPVRLFGGAHTKTTTDLCGFF